MSTLLELTDIVRENLRIDPNKNIWTDTQLKRWINDGLRVLKGEGDYRNFEDEATVTMVDGTQLYTKPTSFKKLLWAKVSDGTALYPLLNITDTLEDYQETYDWTHEDDFPQYIYESENKLGLWPVPNATAAAKTLTIKYAMEHTTLADGAEVDIDGAWQHILEPYAEYRAWAILPNRVNEMNVAKQRWEEGLSQYKADTLRKHGYRYTFSLPDKESKQAK